MKNKKPKSRFKKILYRTLALIILTPIVFILSLIWSIQGGLFGELPTEMEVKFINNHEASQVVSSDRIVLGRYYKENRVTIDLSDIPSHALDALVATEDARFFEHKGVDIIALSRVLVKSILMGDASAGGGSTISQQLAKNVYGRKSYFMLSMPINKIKEMIIASRIETVYTKDQILALYLNTVSFGENVYGIENASLRYFSKHCKNLELEEAAVLIGILKGNTLYNPRKNPENSLNRRNTVLQQMNKYAYLSDEDYEKLIKKPLGLKYKSALGYRQENGYFLDHIKPQVLEAIDKYNVENGTDFNIYTSGLKIETTLDKKLQNNLLKAVNRHLTLLQPKLDKQMAQTKFWTKNRSIIDKFKKKHTNLRTEKSQTLVPWFNQDSLMNLTSIDSLKHCLSRLQASVMAADPETGAVRVWIGGNNHQYAPYNRVLSKRQVGSTFKPIVYYSAMEKGVRPCKMIKNERKVYDEYENWSPRNSDGVYDGYYSVKGALAKSVNTVTAEMLFKAGIDKVIENAQKMGVTSELPEVPSIALGTASISLFEMIQVYTCFANEGLMNKNYCIERITSKDGTVIFEHKSEPKQILRKRIVQNLIGMMKAVADEGTARRLRSIYKFDFEIAAKTGTTQNNTDGWFIGYTPKLVMGVWVGADNPAIHFKDTRTGQGANTALPIWAMGMAQATKKAKDKYTGSFELSNENTLDCVLFNEKKSRHATKPRVRTSTTRRSSSVSRKSSSSKRKPMKRKKKKRKKFKLFN